MREASWHGNRYFPTKPNTQNYRHMSVNIQPLADRVLVEPAAAEEKTASGIIIPDTAKEKPQWGTVVAVGPGKPDEPTTVKVGDVVLYGKYAGTELQVEGVDYLATEALLAGKRGHVRARAAVHPGRHHEKIKRLGG